MYVVRILREVVGKNIVESYSIRPDDELLAETVSPEEYANSPSCRGLLGSTWPSGQSVIRAFNERFANGDALVVGVEGRDWSIVPGRAR
jgi:hypothetical protein